MAVTKPAGKGKASDKKNDDVPFTPVEVVKELPLEKIIDNTLAQNNVTKSVLNALKKKYLVDVKSEVPALKEEFVLKSPTDKETYLLVKEERKGVRKVGIITEKLCETGRAEAIKTQKLWLDKQKEILGDVATVQDQLDEQIKIFEDEEKRLEQVENDRKDQQYNVRQTELIKMGATLANGCLNINDLAIETSNIREADDDIYNETILPLFKMHYEANEKKKFEEEEKKKKDQEEFDKKKKELDEQQEKMRKQQEEFDQKQQQFEQQQKDLKQQKIKSRNLQLEAVGMKYSPAKTGFVYEDIDVSDEKISSLADDQWELLLQDIKPKIEQKVKDAIAIRERTTQRAAKLSELGLTFTGNAHVFEDVNIPHSSLSGMSDNDWNELISSTTTLVADRKQKKIDADKKAWEQQQQQQQEEQKRQQEEDAAKATDKEKWIALVGSLTSVAMPEFKSAVYKNKAAQLTAKIKEIQAL